MNHNVFLETEVWKGVTTHGLRTPNLGPSVCQDLGLGEVTVFNSNHSVEAGIIVSRFTVRKPNRNVSQEQSPDRQGCLGSKPVFLVVGNHLPLLNLPSQLPAYIFSLFYL